MTPADILAAARANPLSAIVPAQKEWLLGWTGPTTSACERCGSADIRHNCSYCGDSTYDHECNDGCRRCGGVPMKAVDLRRPEVRDRLVRCGAPDWCRESVAGMLAWTTGGTAPRFVLREWDDAWAPRVDRWSAAPVNGACVSTMCPDACLELEDWSGWKMRVPAIAPRSGQEVGPDGRACADLAAMHEGCVLTEPDGWYIPLPDGKIGWLPRENA